MNNLKATCPKCQFEYTIPLDRELVRTLPQNSLYWGVYIKVLSEHIGMYPDKIHEELKLMFNPKDSKYVHGAKVGATTTRMTRKEFTQYLENIRTWAFQELNVDLPEGTDDDPNRANH